MINQNLKFDVIIIGAGAAGLMCALTAKKKGCKVLLLEAADSAGKKIRISGGGRCNFTNMHTSSANFLSENPHFCLSSLKRFTSQDFINLVKKHQIPFHEKTLGQLFCDGSSQAIIDMLLKECDDENEAKKVTIWLKTEIGKIAKIDETFQVETNFGKINAKSLVVATGSAAIPKMGATGFGYEIARSFGIKIIQPSPALVPLSFAPELLDKTKTLSGVSLNAIAAIGKVKFREAILFTHRGISGPAILQISSYWNKGQEISINFAPEIEAEKWLLAEKKLNPKQEIQNILTKQLPKSFVKFVVLETKIVGNLADQSNKKLKEIANFINDWRFIPSGTEGFAKAEVAKGGVRTDEVSSKTFESKKVSGLFFIGEVLDVTGHLGGHNFQWAWASGVAAGESVLIG
ncbi:MAG: putative Rossmann fold flavoprotein [Rickettsiales bacterium]|jgi:predicted Rossmann fold flavoprotein